jgi:hypothetical protein
MGTNNLTTVTAQAVWAAAWELPSLCDDGAMPVIHSQANSESGRRCCQVSHDKFVCDAGL